MGVSFHLCYYRKCVSVLVGHKCSVLFFQLSYNRLSGFLSHSSWDFQSSSTVLVRSFRVFFFCYDEKEKKVQYLNPPSLSHVQASICMSRSHVIIPFCSAVAAELFHHSRRLSHSNCTEQLTSHRTVWKPSNICNLGTQQIVHYSHWNGLKMLLLWHTFSLSAATSRDLDMNVRWCAKTWTHDITWW